MASETDGGVRVTDAGPVADAGRFWFGLARSRLGGCGRAWETLWRLFDRGLCSTRGRERQPSRWGLAGTRAGPRRGEPGDVIGGGQPGGVIDQTEFLGFTVGNLRIDAIDQDPADVPKCAGTRAVGIKEE